MSEKKRILLTIYLEEGYYTRVIGQNFDKKRPKANHEDSNGTLRVRYPSQRDYTSECKSKIRVTTLSEETVSYFMSIQSVPKRGKEKDMWKKMKPSDRLKYHLEQLAEGKKFTYEFIGN